MTTEQLRAGKIQVQFNGEMQEARGNWTYNLGRPKRDAIIGADGIHGFSEKEQVAFIEGEITDRRTLDLSALVTLTGATITLLLANKKTIALRAAWYAGEGTGNSEEANIPCRFEAVIGEEITA